MDVPSINWCALLVGAALLAGCGAPEPAADAAVRPADEAPAPQGESPAEATSPGQLPAPTDEPADPAPPSPEAPPPTDPSPTARPTSATAPDEPPLESMSHARPPAKLGVPVDLRYHFEAQPLPNQPVVLHLAAVPRVAGSNLVVSVKKVEGLRVAADKGTLTVQKANARDAYRQQLSLTRQAAGPSELRVLITMDLPEGSAFGFYGIPLEGDTSSQKLDKTSKQR